MQYSFSPSPDQPVTPKISVGGRKNTGTEISITSVLVKGRRLSWSVNGNLTFQNDRITAMPAPLPEMMIGSFKLQKGVPTYAYYTRTFYGVDPQTGAVLFEGVDQYDPLNSEIQIRESGGKRDTVTTNMHIARRTFVGKSALAKGYGSLINSLSYGNFALDMMLTYQFGGWVMDDRYMSPWARGENNFHKDLLKAWQKPGDITDIPLLSSNTTTDFMAASTRWLIRSDYINLAGIRLSYRIPEKVLPFMQLTLFANAENVYFLTHRKGMNPLSSFVGIAESSTYNFARRFNLGLNLKL